MNLSEFVEYDATSPSGLRWKVNRYIGKPKSVLRVAKGDVAGSMRRDGYWKVSINNKLFLAHRVVYSLCTGLDIRLIPAINHKDHNPSNNCFTNLEAVGQKLNMQDTKFRSDNKSGVKGVWFKKDANAWVAETKSKGTKLFKSFSIEKYGNTIALKKAIEARSNQILLMNSRGERFTTFHERKPSEPPSHSS